MPKQTLLACIKFAALLFAIMFSLPSSPRGQSKTPLPVSEKSTNSASSAASPQLVKVERLARQAVFAEIMADDSSYSTAVSQHIKQLVALMTACDDKEGLRQLRPLLRGNYADEFAREIAPAATVSDFRSRLKAAEKVREDYRRDDDVLYIIQQEVERNLFDEAAKTVSKLALNGNRVRALEQISAACRKSGNLTRARNFLSQAITAAVTPDPKDLMASSEYMLEDIADAHQKDGDYEGTRLALTKLLESVATSTPGYRSVVNSKAAEIYAKIGDYDHAHKLVDSLPEPPSEEYLREVRNRVAYNLAVRADPKQAMSQVAELQDSPFLANALREIAEKQATAGDSAEASETLYKALAVAKEMSQWGGAAMAKIALAWADLGNISQADQTLQEALEKDKLEPTEMSRYENDEDVAVAFADLGEFSRALEVAQHLHWESHYVYGNIAYLQTQAGQAQQVLDWASSIRDEEAKAEALLNVCDALSPEK